MQVTLHSTTRLVTLSTPSGEVPARIWEGTTETGIPCHAYITRIAVSNSDDSTQFQRELLECVAPSPALAVIPLRLIL